MGKSAEVAKFLTEPPPTTSPPIRFDKPKALPDPLPALPQPADTLPPSAETIAPVVTALPIAPQISPTVDPERWQPPATAEDRVKEALYIKATMEYIDRMAVMLMARYSVLNDTPPADDVDWMNDVGKQGSIKYVIRESDETKNPSA